MAILMLSAFFFVGCGEQSDEDKAKDKAKEIKKDGDKKLDDAKKKVEDKTK